MSGVKEKLLGIFSKSAVPSGEGEAEWLKELEAARERLRQTYWTESPKGKSEEARRKHDEERREAASSVLQILEGHFEEQDLRRDLAGKALEVYTDPENNKGRVALSEEVIRSSGLDLQGQMQVKDYVAAKIILSIPPLRSTGAVEAV